MSTALQDVLLQTLAEYLPAAPVECNVVLPGVGAAYVGAADSGPLAVRGLVVGARSAPTYLAPVMNDGELCWIGLQEGISTRQIGGLDPALALTEITGVDVTAAVIVAGKQAVAAWMRLPLRAAWRWDTRSSEPSGR